jgi:hypothetical protein
MAAEGVPYDGFLHQRHMGGAFRQLLDAASEERGELLELAVQTLFEEAGAPYVRTGSHEQGEIAERFNLTMTPAPDFVVFEPPNGLRAILECKLTNDALAPVVELCDGRVYTLETLPEILETQPFPRLAGLSAEKDN